MYGCNVGLRVNLHISALLIKVAWIEAWIDRIQRFGIPVKDKGKSLGGLLGHVTPEAAYMHVHSDRRS